MRADLLKRAVALIAAIGADPGDGPELALQRTLLVGVSLTCVVAGIFWGLVYVAVGARLAGSIPLAYAALSLLSTALFARLRRYPLYRFTQLVLILLLPWLMMLSLGGFHELSAVIMWSGLCPLGALLFHELRGALFWFLAFLGLLATGALLQAPAPAPILSPALTTFFYAMNIGGVLTIAFGTTAYFVGQKNLFQEKSEMLLLNVLPKEISDLLKGEQRSIAAHYEQASILFADVVHFTPLSQSMAPLALVGLLDEVFLCFDHLVEKYGLEKIKTIGDCYMVAAGVPRPRPDHAHALARMALEMQASINERLFGGQRLAFRIGMNSGPVVAGVIGRKKFIYDLWGDAVNTASRMETHGSGGTIQITRATYELIQDEFVCEPGGVIDVKGRGEMEVWRLVGEKPRAGADAVAGARADASVGLPVPGQGRRAG